jgi:hypothetical protein
MDTEVLLDLLLSHALRIEEPRQVGAENRSELSAQVVGDAGRVLQGEEDA